MEQEPPIVTLKPDPEPHIYTLFEISTGTWQWVVADPITKNAVIIDGVLDKVHSSKGICTTAADRLLENVRHHGYRVKRILETHAMRDQQIRTAAWYLRNQLREEKGNMPRICTGKSIAGVQRMFARQYRQNPQWANHFDSTFRHGEMFNIGELNCKVLQLSTDTFAFVIGHNVIIGDVPNEQAMQRLAGLTKGYTWHPGGGDSPASSRPQTATTASSDWPTPRPSLSLPAQSYSPLAQTSPPPRSSRNDGRPASYIYEMSA
ncbi:Beta-lactamase hydrolase-like protein [Fulvia fulva]|uniref:Beta-lactamase hydrolase-like protein n=1 Tax=Passalora fulva TaxID=5499 RepID=A0A9Q8P7N6_PASFU|nr:Beta-lactamase hydrolase-like protein [Fulvia fulva]UJO16067.1 Beta-lactamase hydrolase-like protein [Fulvia fulva]